LKGLKQLGKKIRGDYFIFTGNNLENGNVIYFSKKKKWTKNINEAAIVKKDELEKYETLVNIDEKKCKVLNPYFFESNIKGEIVSLREEIRSQGVNILSRLVN
tara:strand:- start:507 stop:815 length:309 start_codon:yes stop_codon:yes gene_type:complete